MKYKIDETLSYSERFKCFIDDIIKGPKKSITIYWVAYGGRPKLFRSAYFILTCLLSLLITIVNYYADCFWDWNSSVIGVIPSILGFSLGGYAILVGFGDEKFRMLIRKKKPGEMASLYMRVNASFLHFILVQFLSMIFAILTKALHISNVFPFNFIGIALFIYALFAIIATSLVVLNLANWFDMMVPRDHQEQEGK